MYTCTHDLLLKILVCNFIMTFLKYHVSRGYRSGNVHPWALKNSSIYCIYALDVGFSHGDFRLRSFIYFIFIYFIHHGHQCYTYIHCITQIWAHIESIWHMHVPLLFFSLPTVDNINVPKNLCWQWTILFSAYVSDPCSECTSRCDILKFMGVVIKNKTSRPRLLALMSLYYWA